jgi:tRNA threonylcarbamoyladenosine biosynthesis protein TsaB
MSDRVLLLGIDTSADTSSDGDLALARLHADGKIELLSEQSLHPRQQSAEFLPKLSLLLEAAHAKIQQLAAIIVVNGPGSFTGLRIGLSAAKGLADAAEIPVIAISSLAVLAGSADKEAASVLQAGRSEYYVRIPSLCGPSFELASVESLETDATLTACIGKLAVVIADKNLADKFPASTSVTIGSHGAYPTILAALPRYLAADFDNIATLDANYIRRPYTDHAPTPASSVPESHQPKAAKPSA